MTPDRTLINKALWLFYHDFTEWRTVLALVAAIVFVCTPHLGGWANA